jgi:uncharacterized protein (DUF302 family)
MENLSALPFIEVTSAYDFETTMTRLTAAIAHAGLKLFARIDHAGAAHEFGLDMPPTVVLIYGHPKGGTPIMLAHPDAALDLPLKLLIREQANQQTTLLYRPIDQVLQAAGVPTELALRLAPAQKSIASAVSGPVTP